MINDYTEPTINMCNGVVGKFIKEKKNVIYREILWYHFF